MDKSSLPSGNFVQNIIKWTSSSETAEEIAAGRVHRSEDLRSVRSTTTVPTTLDRQIETVEAWYSTCLFLRRVMSLNGSDLKEESIYEYYLIEEYKRPGQKNSNNSQGYIFFIQWVTKNKILWSLNPQSFGVTQRAADLMGMIAHAMTIIV